MSVTQRELDNWFESFSVPISHFGIVPVSGFESEIMMVSIPGIGIRQIGIENDEAAKACLAYLKCKGVIKYSSADDMMNAMNVT